MNNRLAWRVAVRDSDLDATAKHVALTLDIYMNRRGIAWPSRRSLAAGTGRTVRTVERAVARLEQAGFLVVAHSTGRRSNLYCAVIHNRGSGDAVAVEPTASEKTPTASEKTANRVSGDALSRKEVVIRTTTADRARDQNQTGPDPDAVEIAHRWLADHPFPSGA